MSGSLLQRVAAKDPSAVQECIDRYGGLVWSLARRFCGGNQTDAEDAVQDVFISLWQNAERFDESVASETTFIAMITRRRLIDRRRKQMRRRDGATMPAMMPEPIAPGGGESELSDEASYASRVLAELRPEQKNVLEMSLLYGRTYEQIAESTGTPVGTVKTHARRGLIRVREIIAENREKMGQSAKAKMEVNS